LLLRSFNERERQAKGQTERTMTRERKRWRKKKRGGLKRRTTIQKDYTGSVGRGATDFTIVIRADPVSSTSVQGTERTLIVAGELEKSAKFDGKIRYFLAKMEHKKKSVTDCSTLENSGGDLRRRDKLLTRHLIPGPNRGTIKKTTVENFRTDFR